MNANDAPKGAVQSPTTKRNSSLNDTGEGETVDLWRIVALGRLITRLHRRIVALELRTTRLEARLDELSEAVQS